jgi:hypothetical protein
VNRLALALDLGRLANELDRLADWSPGRDPASAAIAASYLDLLCRLSTIDDGGEQIERAVTMAVGTFNVTRQDALAHLREHRPGCGREPECPYCGLDRQEAQ